MSEIPLDAAYAAASYLRVKHLIVPDRLMQGALAKALPHLAAAIRDEVYKQGWEDGRRQGMEDLIMNPPE